MASKLQLAYDTAAATVYAILRNQDGEVWNGAAFEAYVTANLGTYDLPMTEQGTASRYYTVTMPTVVLGTYSVAIYLQAGGAPAETDTLLTGGSVEYTGSAFETPQTGDSFARIGAAGSGLTDLGGMSTGMKAEVESEANDALVGQNLDHLIKVAVDTNLQTTVDLNSVFGYLMDAGTTWTYDRAAASLEGFSNYVQTATAAIVADTNELQTDWANGGRLDLILDARASQASVDAIDAAVVKIQAATYDSASATGDVITLSNAATQTVTAAGRVTA
jgi:hypothetical protein